jgi:tetratricopeptide (TPR) repeat protein
MKKNRARNDRNESAQLRGVTPLQSWKGFGYLSATLIVVAGLIVYWNSLDCSFHFDDETSIINNQAIRDPWNWKAIWAYSPARFVTYLTFAINYRLHGLSVPGFHIGNLAIHLGTALVVWWLASLTFRTPALRKTWLAQYSPAISLFSGLLFVVHPIQTQAVTYIVQRAASLATFFYVASLGLYVRARLWSGDEQRRTERLLCYSGAVLLGALGILTKETILTLPLACLLYEISFLRQGKIDWRIVLALVLPFLLVPGVLLLTRVIPLADAEYITPIQYLLTQFKVLAMYLRLLVVPVGQNLDHDIPLSNSLLEASTASSLLFLLIILFTGWKLFGKARVVSFGIFWFFLTLLPESSLIPIRDVMVEHRLYLPMVGFALLLPSLAFSLARAVPIRVITSALVLLVGWHGMLSIERNRVWKNDWTLWNDVIQKSPNKARGYSNRGIANLSAGALERAIADYNYAIRLDPSYGLAFVNRGNAYLVMGEYDRAIADYEKALELGLSSSNDIARLHYNRGTAFLNKGDIPKALKDLNRALEMDPYYAEAYYNRGNIESREGKVKEALEDYDRALKYKPTYAKAFNNRGLVFKSLGQFPRALEDFNQAIRIQPNFAEAHFNRGAVWNQQQRPDSAISDFTEAIRLRPSDPDGYSGRGLAYYSKKEYDRALLDYTRALELNPLSAELFRDRALVYHAMNDHRKAREDLSKAESLGLRDPFLEGFIRAEAQDRARRPASRK